MSFRDLKILPMLIVVAFLAFSVRLIDVVGGVATLAGAAHAEEKKPEEKKDEKTKAKEHESEGSATIPLPPPIEGSMDSDKKGSLQFPDTPTDACKNGKPIGWQDASEMDVGNSDVRKDLGDDLGQRRADLDRHEKELQTKEALLKAGQQELERKFSELSQLRTEIEKLLQTQSKEEEDRTASLVKIYEGMKPGDAARIFNTLDLDVLLQVMSKMSERKLSPIMGQMDSERAKTITMMLAQQKQLPALPPSN